MSNAEEEFFCGSSYHCEYIPFLRYWPVIVFALLAAGYALYAVFGIFLIVIAVVVIAYKSCFPNTTKHIGTERLQIVGATGPDAATIDGIYEPTDEVIGYATVYRKVGDGAV